MKIYHGALAAVEEPRIIKVDRVGDFGIGFYTTTDIEQARRFVVRKCGITGADRGVVSSYEVPDDVLTSAALHVKRFDGPIEDWVKFVFANRRAALFEHGFDLVFGPVANDQVYASLALFEDGQIGPEELIRRLRSRKLTNQLLFHTAKALALLRYVGGTEVVCPVR